MQRTIKKRDQHDDQYARVMKYALKLLVLFVRNLRINLVVKESQQASFD